MTSPAPKYLLDTNVMSELIRHLQGPLARRVSALPAESCVTSVSPESLCVSASLWVFSTRVIKGPSRPPVAEPSPVSSPHAPNTQYMTSDPVLAIAEDPIKGALHDTLDRAIINSVFGTAGSPPLPGRCARWRPMP